MGSSDTFVKRTPKSLVVMFQCHILGANSPMGTVSLRSGGPIAKKRPRAAWFTSKASLEPFEIADGSRGQQRLCCFFGYYDCRTKPYFNGYLFGGFLKYG